MDYLRASRESLEEFMKFLQKKNNQKGQSTIEYLLVLGVVFILVLNLLNSPFFANMMGSDGDVFTAFKKYIEYSYRHTHFKKEGDPLDNFNGYTGNHESFTQPNIIDTRFFLVRNPYGAP
jgi:hypothetical protein